MIDPSTLTQAECDAILAARFERLRRLHDLCQPGICSCHGLGYVPKVDLEGLLEAMGANVFHPYEPRPAAGGWLWAWEPRHDRLLVGIEGAWGDTPLLAASRAAVAAVQGERRG